VSGRWATCSRRDPIERRVAEDLQMQVDTAGCEPKPAMALRADFAPARTAETTTEPRPRAVAHALRIVVAAEAVMDADLTRPVYAEQLCAALGISARCLHDAFHTALGVSPHAHLKSRRLMLARRALSCRQGGAELVKSVALGHGFWLLGHFARDYRACFGELPSVTLASRVTKV
jgi:transcriptional regulator GlxA family with amidase domain